ncbi:MAG: hypothetical protein QXW50_04840 [Nitrososphaerota archaeon]
MRGKEGFIGRAMSELERGLTTYSRYRVWLLTDLISWPFWTLFFFLSFLVYSPTLLSSQYHMNAFTWCFFVFVFVSSFMWSSTSLATSAQEGILEYVLLTGSSIRQHLLGRMVISFLDLAVGGSVLLLISALGFGTRLSIASPLLMALALIQAAAFFYLFSSILASLLVSLRSPWVVINVAQFLVPFTSGAIPIEVLPPEIQQAIIYSPFFYIVHPIIASATGVYYLPPETIFLIGGLLTLSLYFLSRVLENLLLKRALRLGRFTFF